MTEDRKHRLVLRVGCPYCGARPHEECVVTLAPEIEISSLWSHGARELAAHV